ncbi:Putative F-box/FBD/LRR-repeat protein At5g44950 [Linum perenne]
MSQRKRKRGENVLIDRLSDLPDCILHHIMSFLDTTSIVRTSILSKRWRCLWKEAPAINFKRSCFDSEQGFIEHVIDILCFRYSHAPVKKISLEYNFTVWTGVVKVFDRIMKYAACCGNGGHLHHLSLCHTDRYAPSFNTMSASIIAYCHHESLTTLELASLHLTHPPSSSFISLTTLQLNRCHFFYIDPFDEFPCLKYLKLVGCASSVKLVVSGLELLDLDIQWPCHVNSGPIEVFAPKLESLRFLGDDEGSKVFPKLNVPALNHANIRLRWWNELEFLNDEFMDDANRGCVNLLCGLHNVESLILCFDNCVQEYDVKHNSPFVGMKSLMEVEPSPFTRLKTLRVQYKKGLANIPYEVIRYFFDGSHSKEKSFVLEKI